MNSSFPLYYHYLILKTNYFARTKTFTGVRQHYRPSANAILQIITPIEHSSLLLFNNF